MNNVPISSSLLRPRILPFAARRRDIPPLVWYFVTKSQSQLGKRIENIPKAATDALIRYEWPGNVRELQNVVQPAVILSPGLTLRLNQFLPRPLKRHKISTPHQDVETIERAHIAQVLENCGWRIKGEGNAADLLGLKPSTLRSHMKRLGIERP